MNIRKASLQDIVGIQVVALLTWSVAYRDILSLDQMEFMLETMYFETELCSAINEGFFVAEHEATPVGFASVTLVSKSTYKLNKLYVVPELQGHSIGKQLLHTVENHVIEKGGDTLVLNVNRANAAKFFYERKGFTILREEDNYIGNSYWMNDYVMEKKLN